MNWDKVKEVGKKILDELALYWDMVKTVVGMLPKKGRYALYGALGLILFLVVVGAARAENAPASNFGYIASLDGGPLVRACYLSDASEAAKVGTIYTCLVLQLAGPKGPLVSTGAVTFCTQTGVDGDSPVWGCGKYEDMRKLATGI